jgi:hypothetical protein
MSGRTPPSGLPRSFRGIWEALKAADEKAASRQALARDLGVATHTLQRILVSGDVPSFAKGTNNRIRRAWARTLARLARQLGHDPREWVEAAGIRWEPDIEAAVNAALLGIERRPAARSATTTAVRGTRTRGHAGAVRLAVVRGSPLATALRLHGMSFLERYARRLVNSLEPGSAIESAVVSEEEAVADLLGPSPSYDMAAGVIATVSRRAAAASFHVIPGWRGHIEAVALRIEGSTAPFPGWRDVTPGSATRVAALDEAARQYLIAQRGFAAESLAVICCDAGAELSGAVARMLERSRSEAIVLVGLEWSCRSARETLAAIDRFALKDVAGNPRPSYPLSIAVSARANSWAGWLDRARDEEMFECAVEDAAHLYADAAAEIELGGRAGWVAAFKPEHFALATPAFQAAYCARLVGLLAEDLRPVVEPRLSSLSPVDRADRIGAIASTLVPGEWREALDAARARLPAMHAIEAPSSAGASRFCRSCSVSLFDEHNRGVSDRYCRYCADDEGQLKPREEVRRLLAGWIAHWQGGVDEKESYERADSLMSAMPAWSRN